MNNPTRPVVGQLLTCNHCNVEFERTYGYGAAPKYCGATCRNAKAHKRAKADGRYEEWIDRRKAKRKPASFTLACDQCGEVFDSPRSNTMYCSKVCGHRAYNEQRKKDGRLQGVRSKLKDKQTAWSTQSRLKHGSSRKRYPDVATKHDTKRRLIIASATVEAVDRKRVFERDNWTCQLCKQPVDSAIAWPDPMAGSLDHVVPVSKGGEHSMSNTQLAHLKCNLSKGNRVPE